MSVLNRMLITNCVNDCPKSSGPYLTFIPLAKVPPPVVALDDGGLSWSSPAHLKGWVSVCSSPPSVCNGRLAASTWHRKTLCYYSTLFRLTDWIRDEWRFNGIELICVELNTWIHLNVDSGQIQLFEIATQSFNHTADFCETLISISKLRLSS